MDAAWVDRSVARDVVEALEAAYADFLDDVQANAVPARLEPESDD